MLLAVSGGPDSLAMLLLAHAAIPETIEAATVDHQLRSEAAAEAEYVASVCARLRIPHSILRPEQPITGNLQSAARTARYALLEQQAKDRACGWIATAHHADDQLETVLMRIARGSGIDGLAAVREKQGHIIRPLLGYDKAELTVICRDCGLASLHDPSNDNSAFDRVAMRQWLTQTSHPFSAKRAVRSAQAFAETAEALDWMVANLATTHLTLADGEARLNAQGLPCELQRRLLLRAVQHVQPGCAPRGEAIVRALSALAAGEKLTLGNILCIGGSIWHFQPAPQRRQ